MANHFTCVKIVGVGLLIFSYVGMINICREQPEKAKFDITTSEVGNVRFVRAIFPNANSNTMKHKDLFGFKHVNYINTT